MLQQGVNELLRTGGDYERQGSLSCSLMPYCTASGSLSAIYCLFFFFCVRHHEMWEYGTVCGGCCKSSRL